MRPIHFFLPWYQQFENKASAKQVAEFLHNVRKQNNIAIRIMKKDNKCPEWIYLSGFQKAIALEIDLLPTL